MVELIPVLSSNIAAIGYDARSTTLLVRFHHGARVYSYRGVPTTVFRAFLTASSKGTFFSHFIKGVYPYARVA